MDKKLLVNYIKPALESLQNEGLKITRAEIWPGELRGYYTLAISAEWNNDSFKDQYMLIANKLRAMMPIDSFIHIMNIYTFGTPESIDEYIDYYVVGRDFLQIQSLYPTKLEAVAA